LARDRDKAEVADRGADRLIIAINDDHPQSAAGRRKRMREADDTRTDNSDVV
jgi:hypothetical protein